MKYTDDVFEKLCIRSTDPFQFEHLLESVLTVKHLSTDIQMVYVSLLVPEDEPYNILNIDSFDMHLQDFEIFEIYTLCDGQAYNDREILYQHENLLVNN